MGTDGKEELLEMGICEVEEDGQWVTVGVAASLELLLLPRISPRCN